MEMGKEHKMYVKELERRIKALSKFKSPAFREEKEILKGELEWIKMGEKMKNSPRSILNKMMGGN
jgi:hypothetical protein